MMAMLSSRRSARSSLPLLSMLVLSSAVDIEITSPTSESAYHVGDEVLVQWFYDGTGEKFQIELLKEGNMVADLCASEEEGLCFDLTHDQTVLLPSADLESGSDYTITVKDISSDAQHVSEPFTIIGDPDSNIEITAPDGTRSLNAGDEIEVEWLYVGNNELFDIYLRQGDGDLSVRVSENLCIGEPDGSCVASNIGSAVVTLPAELEDGADYSLLVVDRRDDDAYGMSRSLSVGVDVSSAGNGDGVSTGTSIAIVIAACVGGICLIAVLMGLLRRRKRERRREEKLATLGALQKRRSAPPVVLAVEDMQQPDTPESDDPKDSAENFINPIYSTSQSYYEGQITPPPEDTTLWRRSREAGRFMGRQISRSFSRSQSLINE